MRLKTLRLAGFKSFADRTEFQFPDGITAIVGPNGCGKSNVVDALKWVLGEQRPGALRGSEMADVIFGGTSTRKPLGFAEVALVLDNSGRSIPLDFAEIEVSRRLYRDGTSEYQLNRSPCRLRDLRELLMDTGSGPGAMSVMEQGRIDQILRESVEERRAVFEEAAGVAKYKARRREALRRLERVEADLLRVTDVVSEKERLVRSLRIQAGRAERYQALVDEMKAKRLVLALHRYGQLLEERGSAAARVAGLEAAETEARTQVRDALAASRRQEEELDARRERIVRKEQETASLQAQADTAREKSAFATRLASELDGKIRWYAGEIESSAARLAELTAAQAEVEAATLAAEADRTAKDAALAAAERGIEAARATAHESRAAAQRLAERAYENLSRQSRLGATRSRLEAEIQALDDRETRLGKRLASLDGEIAAAAQRAAECESAGAAAASSRETAAAAVTSGEERIRDAESKLARLREEVASADREVSSTRSRVDVLRAFEARHEGVGEGPKRFLEAARREPERFPSVRGLLASLVETDAARSAEVETALGAWAQAVVVATFDDAVRAAEIVRERKLPRCAFLPLDGAAPAAAAPGPDGAQRILSVVRCAEDVRPAVEAILSDAVAANSLAEARDLRAAEPRLRVVLSDGTVVDAVGAVCAGGPGGGAGILQRRTELRDLTVQLDDAASRLAASRVELTAAEGALARLRQETSVARDALRAADAALQRARSDAERARADGQRLTAERGHVGHESAEIETRTVRARAELAKAESESARIAAEQAETEGLRASTAHDLDRAEHALRAAEDRRTDARVQAASVAERCASLAARAESVVREVADLEETVRDARTELADCERRRAEAVERGREAQRTFEQTQRSREAAVEELAVLRHEASASHSALEQRRSLLDRLEAEASKVSHELHRFRLEEHEARVRVENLIERVRDELQSDLAAAWERRRAEGAAEDGTPVFAEGGAPAATDLSALETEVAELRVRIEKMGAVNLEALAQLQDAEREATALRAQHDDLTKSRESLLQAIRRIDQESRALFEETFQKVRANFQEMFRRLFGGGKADVFLTEGQDVLEAGIEIVARPPGKEQRSISLLSGGERTMTAVALLFAIYQAKPSPFCLMDEVDAALDENNIDRFVGVLREFAQQSQFVIVSHNKRTISAAGTIVGVSMPDPGVSRKIAVRLEDVADDGQLRDAALAG